MKCEDCDSSNAKYRCMDCGAYFCKKCKDAMYDLHECNYIPDNIVTIDEYEKAMKRIRRKINVKCNLHNPGSRRLCPSTTKEYPTTMRSSPHQLVYYSS